MHEVPGWVGWMPFSAMLAGFALSYVYYIAAPWLPAATARTFRPLYLFLLNKWYFDELYNAIFVKPANAIGRFLWKRGDGAVIDGTIDGTANFVGRATGRVVKLQSGYVYHYAFAMLIGLAAIVTWFMASAGRGRREMSIAKATCSRIVTFLPLVGALLIMLMAFLNREATGNARMDRAVDDADQPSRSRC